jgi:SET domain-containing protein
MTRAEAEKSRGKYLMDIDVGELVDGSTRSNLARYINHSCDANAEAIFRQKVWICR